MTPRFEKLLIKRNKIGVLAENYNSNLLVPASLNYFRRPLSKTMPSPSRTDARNLIKYSQAKYSFLIPPSTEAEQHENYNVINLSIF